MRLTAAFAIGLLMLFGAVPAFSHGDEKFGEPGDPKAAARDVTIVMDETADGHMSYSPNKLEVKLGEQIRFVLENHGKVDHDFFLGPEGVIDEHAEEVKKDPNTEIDEPNWTRVKAGGKGELRWHFTEPGDLDYASVIPGQIEAGMFGAITVK
jgi:uncharacterized cupredoxin-like copper-binding protein